MMTNRTSPLVMLCQVELRPMAIRPEISSFTVTEPESAKLEMTTALIYPPEHTKGYEIIQGK